MTEQSLQAANERIEHLEFMLAEISARAEVDGLAQAMPGLHLTRTHARLLAALKNHPGTMGRPALCAAMYWDRPGSEDRDPKIIDVLITTIRRNLREAGYGNPIKTIWGQGYRWDPDQETTQ